MATDKQALAVFDDLMRRSRTAALLPSADGLEEISADLELWGRELLPSVTDPEALATIRIRLERHQQRCRLLVATMSEALGRSPNGSYDEQGGASPEVVQPRLVEGYG